MYVFFTVHEHNFWACSGLYGKLERDWRVSQLGLAAPLHSTTSGHVCFPLPSSPSHCFLSSYVSGLRTRLPDGPPSDLTQPAAVTDSSNGRALLHAAEEHVPIACSYINIRVGSTIVIICNQIFISFFKGLGDMLLKNLQKNISTRNKDSISNAFKNF